MTHPLPDRANTANRILPEWAIFTDEISRPTGVKQAWGAEARCCFWQAVERIMKLEVGEGTEH
jgi:hypothetical protein